MEYFQTIKRFASIAKASYEKSTIDTSKNGEGRAESVELKASAGWLEKFLRRNNLSLRRKTSVVQKDPDKLIPKLVSYIIHVRRVHEKQKYELVQIIAMNETPAWSDMVFTTATDATGKKNNYYEVHMS